MRKLFILAAVLLFPLEGSAQFCFTLKCLNITRQAHFGPPEAALDPGFQGYNGTGPFLFTTLETTRGTGVSIESQFDVDDYEYTNIGLEATALNRGSSDAIGIYGVGISWPGEGKLADHAFGILGGAQNGFYGGTHTGTVGKLVSVWADANANYGGTVEQNIGLLIDLQAGVGEANYGIFVRDQGTGSADYAIQVEGGKSRFGGPVLLNSAPPATASSDCSTGTVTWDSGFVYVCVAANTWKRSNLASW